MEGKVIYETRNCFVIDLEDGRRVVAKKARIFLFKCDNHFLLVSGDKLVGRPEERVKRV